MTATATETCGELAAGEPCVLRSGHAVPCSASEDFPIPMPTSPWDAITPGLYQGGSVWEQPSPDEFDSVLSLWHRAPWSPEGINERRFHFNDGREIPQGLAGAVDWVHQQWAVQKKHVLVRCQAGLNRSGLVVALVLVKEGYDPELAIDTIRDKRSPYALCNPIFEAYLRSLA